MPLRCTVSLTSSSQLRRAFGVLLIASVANSLSGCVTSKEPDLTVAIPKAWQAQIQTGDTGKLEKNWWVKANDLSLNNLMTKVLAENLTLQQAGYRLAAAREDTLSPSYLPHLDSSANTAYSKTTDIDNPSSSSSSDGLNKKTTSFYKSSVDASWELPIWGQLSSSKNIAKASETYAEKDLELLRTMIEAETISSYADLRAAQSRLRAYETLITNNKRLLVLHKIKRDAGLSDNTPVLQQERTLLDMQSLKGAEENSYNQALKKIHQLIGNADVQSLTIAPGTLHPMPVLPIQDTPLDVLRNRPDISKAEASVLIAAGQADLARDDLLPKITIAGSFGKQGNMTGVPLTADTMALGWGPTLQLPLFDWGKRLAEIRKKDAALNESVAGYKETVVNAITDANYDILGMQIVAEDFERKRAALLNAQKQAEATAIKFKQGLVSEIEFLTDRNASTTANLDYINAQKSAWQQMAALSKSLGGGIPLLNNQAINAKQVTKEKVKP